MVVGGVEGRERLMVGFREDLRVMFIVFVVEVARSAPGGADGMGVERSFCGLGARGCWGWGSLGRVNWVYVSCGQDGCCGMWTALTGMRTPNVLGSKMWFCWYFVGLLSRVVRNDLAKDTSVMLAVRFFWSSSLWRAWVRAKEARAVIVMDSRSCTIQRAQTREYEA